MDFITYMPKGKQPMMNVSYDETQEFSVSNMNAIHGNTPLHLSWSCYEIGGTSGTVYSVDNPALAEQDDGCHLVLGLGPTPYFSSRLDKAKESAMSTKQHQVSEIDSDLLELGLSRRNGESIVIAQNCSNASSSKSQLTSKEKIMPISDINEHSTSARRNSGGYMPALLFAPRQEEYSSTIGLPETLDQLNQGASANANDFCLQNKLQISSEPLNVSNSPTDTCPDSSIHAKNTHHHHHHLKKCMFKGCSKGARGTSGLCIGHGGGQRCKKPGCNKGAESRTVFCKAHGGGRRCQMLGCTKSAEGRTEYCIAHGGGRRCCHHGCKKAARGKSGLCIKHGGGKRCSIEGCTRSAEGQAGLCISHGGGRRCQYPQCGKGAQGCTEYCKAHGGGKRCISEGCTKGAEGSTPLCKAHGGGKRCHFQGGGICPKSVHGGTQFCVAHGGGKRCAIPGCTKSARGRTDCCVKHGGGKRCKFDGCDKSAQGSTDFCKAHGGGKRCTWASGCDKFARGRSGLCAAHATMMAPRQHHDSGNGGSMISSSLFQGIVPSSITVRSNMDKEQTCSGLSIVSDYAESQVDAGKQQVHIPPGVLVPNFMKSHYSSSVSIGMGTNGVKSHGTNFEFSVPEGRVHGGSLLSLLGGSFKNAMDAGLV